MGGITSGINDLLGGAPNNAGFQAQGPTPAQIAASSGLVQGGLTQQQQLINALQAQNGIQNQSNVFNQLQGVANGTGPNPAMAQLNNATGQNVANQAALMAGQRGAGANVGLIGREAAQQGAGLQQQAVGQGAALQAQQSLGALNQLGGIAGQQVGQQQQALQGYNQLAQNNQGQLLGAQDNANNANAGVASNNARNSAGAIGGLINAAGPAIGMLVGGPAGAAAGSAAAGAFNDSSGGYHSNTYATGGEVENPKVAQVPEKARFPGALQPHIAHMAQIYHPEHFSGGGKVNAMVSPGEVYLPPDKAGKVAKGEGNPLKEGQKIPGKAVVKGDSKKNDIVPAKLEEGGVVIPREVLQSKDPESAAAKFVAAHLKKHGSGDEEGDFKSALKKAISNRKSK